MIFKIGMMLLCNYNFYGIDSYKARLTNVPAQIIGLTDKYAILEYDFKNIQNLVIFHDSKKVVEVNNREDLDSSYLNCRIK